MNNPSIDELLGRLPDHVGPDPAFEGRLRRRLAAELAELADELGGAGTQDPSAHVEEIELQTTMTTTSVDTAPTGTRWFRAAAAAAAVLAVAAVAVALAARDDGATTTAGAPDVTFDGAALDTFAIDVTDNDPNFVAAADDHVWVLTLVGDLVRVDARTGAADLVATVSEASPLTVDEDAVWIADAVDGTVVRLDPEDGHVVAEIETGIEVLESTIRIPMAEGGSRPFSMIGGIVSDGDTVYVGDRAGQVLRIDPSSNEVSGSFEVPVRPDSLRLAGDHLLVSDLTGGEVAVVSIDSGDVLREAQLDELAGAALHGGALYVQDAATGTLTRIDLESGEQRSSEPLGPSPELIGQPVLPTAPVVTAAGVLVDTASQDGSLRVLDLETLAVTARLATPVDHGDMVVAPDGSVWLVRANAQALVRITPQPR